MWEFRRLLVAQLQPDPEQPRKTFAEEETLLLGKSMLAVKQRLPGRIRTVPAK